MNTRTPTTMLMFATLFGVSLMNACGAKVEPDKVTETGNPSLLDKTRITTTPLDGTTIGITGEKNAVPPNATVTVTNRRTDEEQSTTAEDDGSFTLQIAGQAGDAIVIDVESNGKSDEFRFTVDGATTSAPASGTVTQVVAPTSASDPVAPVPSDDTTMIDTTDELITTPDDTDETDTTDLPTRPIASTPTKHRSGPSLCDSERAPGDVEGETYPVEGECETDDDCQEGNLGRCQNNRDYSYCTYDECRSDDDCAEGPCECGVDPSSANKCLRGNCQVDNDCGGTGYCSPTLSTCGNYSGVVAYWCHTPEDECMNDDECVSESQGSGYCMYSSEVAHWLCAYSHCVG